MADVIRRAIVEVELRQKGGGSAGGSGGGAYSEVARATKEVEKATKEATRATTEFGFKTAANFREAGEGALRLARGIAFLAASGSEDMKKLTQSIAMAAGGFDVAAGALKLVTNVSVAFGSTAAIAVGAVTGAVALGAAAWIDYKRSVEEAARAARDEAQRAEETAARIQGRQRTGAEDRADFLRRRAGFALSPEERMSRANDVLANASAERGLTNDASRQRSAAERGAEAQRDLFEITREMLEEQRRAALNAVTQPSAGPFMGQPFSGGDTDSAKAEINRQFDRELDIARAKFQRQIDSWLEMFETATNKMRQQEAAQEVK